jgi:hypothetical protein
MNGPNGQPDNCSKSIKFMKRFALKPTLFTRARGQCISCDYTSEQGCPFTQEQLNMRRKAEVLQYKNNSNFTGALTKAEKYSLIARRKGPNQKTYGTQTQTYTNPNTLDPTNPATFGKTVIPSSFTPTHFKDCPQVKTSTHGSDVPGPRMELYLDNNVPLTNYITRRNYSGNHSKSDFVFIPKISSAPRNTSFTPSKDSSTIPTNIQPDCVSLSP